MIKNVTQQTSKPIVQVLFVAQVKKQLKILCTVGLYFFLYLFGVSDFMTTSPGAFVIRKE